MSDKPVALLDLDQVFSNMAVMLNLTPSHSLGDLADSDPADLDDSVFARVAFRMNLELISPSEAKASWMIIISSRPSC